MRRCRRGEGRPEPRLGLSAQLLDERVRNKPVYLPLQGNWFSALSKLADDRTAIFYFADMPPRDLPDRAENARRSRSFVTLAAEPDLSIRLETLSGSAAFARRLRAAHVVLEYPGPGAIRVRPFDPDDASLCCPLQDWIFWPALSLS